MRRIVLTGGKSALVDNADYEWLSMYQWKLCKFRKIYYVRRFQGGKTFYMHRDILSISSNLKVDHIDRNGLNNQRANLRICTNSQNQANRTTTKGSKYKGAIWNKSANSWAARIKVDGKDIWLGCFKSRKKAAYAYNEAAKKYFGEFARLNS